MSRRRSTIEKLLRIAVKQRQILLSSDLTVAFVVRNEQACYLSRQQRSFIAAVFDARGRDIKNMVGPLYNA